MGNALNTLSATKKEDTKLYNCIKELYEQGVPFDELKALIPDMKRTREQLRMKRMLKNNNEVLTAMIIKKNCPSSWMPKSGRKKNSSKRLDQLIRQQQSFRKEPASRTGKERLKRLPCQDKWQTSRVIRQPCQMNGPRGAVSLFCDNDLRLIRRLCIFIILIVTVNKHTNIGVLSAPDSKVGKHRFRSGLCSTARLSCDNAITGTFSSLATPFRDPKYQKFPADATPHARLLSSGHQLQVVNDDQVKILLQLILPAFAS